MEDLNEMQTPATENTQSAPETLVENNSAETTPAAEPTAQTEASATETVQEPAAKTEETADEAAPAEEAFVEPAVDYANFSREQLNDALRELLNEPNITHIKNRASNIKNAFNALNREVQKAAFEAFLAEGGNKDEYQPADDEVANTFHKLYGQYRDRRQKYIDEQEAIKQNNLTQKRQILDDLRQLIDAESEDTLKQTYDKFNAIQDRWKSVGDVPRSEMNDLWQNYHFLVEQFFNKVKINKELMMLDYKRNLDQKVVLCEKAEELIVEPSVTKASQQLQELRRQWKEIGPVPSDKNDEIWTRFCSAADQVMARYREYSEQRNAELNSNLLAKQALVEKAAILTAENPTSTKQWNDVSTELDEMLKLWKTIGPVPREKNEEIWNAFKGAIDGFYTRKKEYISGIRTEQDDNYNRKVDLCLQAEAIAKREDWKKATDELLKLQAEWKQIGAVSRKVSDKIWQRFRAACDEFFAKKAEYFSNIKGAEQENLAKKEAIIEQLKAYEFGENKEENLRVIKDFQRQWMDIGYVPISEKARLQKEFRDVINGHFEKLKITAREAEENAYRERIRNVAGDVSKFASNEKQAIQEKIDKLRSDISLWENNLGFLASSKQADLLKEEFQKKMQSARQQVALLQAKLRILNESRKENKEEAAEAPKADNPENAE